MVVAFKFATAKVQQKQSICKSRQKIVILTYDNIFHLPSVY